MGDQDADVRSPSFLRVQSDRQDGIDFGFAQECGPD